MKIGDFPLVETLVDVRARMIHQRDHGKIAIEVDGRRMPPDFVSHIAPAIKLELRNQIAEVDEQLRQLGVVISTDA
jgi:hypothetical protein